ncbi:MAG TPA: excinuclease ABC subunit UvrB [Bdellovibrionota bacterium]|nr:excinuclease ABC subunit UvrB [Bdellovibrionota bacterium]
MSNRSSQLAFQLVSSFKPKGDQPQAIEQLIEGLEKKKKHQVLLGITGSGKTFTMANVIAQCGKPALVVAPNKTLAAQLYTEFREFFPRNAVEYFVSYYDYYQPEAYIPSTDTYIEKDSSINDEIDKLRHSTTRSVLTRRDTIVVASVSCIYGLGSPEDYEKLHVTLTEGMKIDRDEVLKRLVSIQYVRETKDFYRGSFRVSGDRVDVFPANEEDRAYRLEFFGDEIEKIVHMDPLTGEVFEDVQEAHIYPTSHFVTGREKLDRAIESIRLELRERLPQLNQQNKIKEAERLEQRTLFDLEMIEELGYCNGIENYSRHIDGRKPGGPPSTLLDYFPDDFLLFIDESHISVPQLGGMYKGDRARKETLVEHGFRLPSALDNRPLSFNEFQGKQPSTIYVSATPASYELEQTQGEVVEQIIRPTGLMDPQVFVHPATHQVDHLLSEIKKRIQKKQRVLVTTLTKKMSEELAEYLQELDIKVKYLHSDIKTLERSEILRALRVGDIDVLVGINLLREGLDLPEVSLVAILDADKEGFLRSKVSLIQTMGRAARNVEGTVIMYADVETLSMREAISETQRRRKLQEEFNKKNGITPQSIQKNIHSILESVYEKDYVTVQTEKDEIPLEAIPKEIKKLQKQMKTHAKRFEFEEAARLRDRILQLEKKELGV